MRKEIIEYFYKNKNGLKNDFLKSFSEDDYKASYLTNLIVPCVRSNGEASWKITKECYDLYLTINPDKDYNISTLFDKIQDFLNYIVYFKQRRKEYEIREKRKKEYFS